MPGVFYFLLAAMLATYAVLDGFDFGVGILHLFVAKTDEERRTVFGAIGPVWDGNEVWLIASGGVFFFAFPNAYAAALSGLYLPFMIVLWLLVLRGVAIEFRSQLDHVLWRAAFDTVFAFASTVMALVLGVAYGNLLRGVPLDATGFFQEDLFTSSTGRGALDFYTAVIGLFAVVTLAAHGATYLVWKTTGPVQERSKAWATRLWPVAGTMTVVTTAATAGAAPDHFSTLASRPWLYPLPLLALASAFVCRQSIHQGHEARAFAASSTFIVSLLFATAGTLYPVLLRSTNDPAFSIDVTTSSATSSLTLGLAILAPALAIAVSYFAYLYRSFRGKVQPDDHHHY